MELINISPSKTISQEARTEILQGGGGRVVRVAHVEINIDVT
jgi:hypothetical protein